MNQKPEYLPEEPFAVLCFSGQDRPRAEGIARQLQEAGGRAAYASSGSPAQYDALAAHCAVCIACVSKAAVGDLTWRQQITETIERQIPIVALMLEWVSMPDVLETQLSRFPLLVYPKDAPVRMCRWVKMQPSCRPCFSEKEPAPKPEPQKGPYMLLHLRLNREIPLSDGTLRLGAKPSICDYPICDNAGISRRHADVVVEGDACYAVDLDSSNGTRINGRLIPPGEKTPLRIGDTLSLDRETFRLMQRGEERQ